MRWDDIWRNKEKYARGIWVCFSSYGLLWLLSFYLFVHYNIFWPENGVMHLMGIFSSCLFWSLLSGQVKNINLLDLHLHHWPFSWNKIESSDAAIDMHSWTVITQVFSRTILYIYKINIWDQQSKYAIDVVRGDMLTSVRVRAPKFGIILFQPFYMSYFIN